MLDLSKFKKTVMSPYTGQDYEIVRVTRREVLESTGVLPIVLAAPVEKRLQALETGLKEKADNGEIQEQVTKDMLAKGVLSPRIWLRPRKSPERRIPVNHVRIKIEGIIRADSFESNGKTVRILVINKPVITVLPENTLIKSAATKIIRINFIQQ